MLNLNRLFFKGLHLTDLKGVEMYIFMKSGMWLSHTVFLLDLLYLGLIRTETTGCFFSGGKPSHPL